MSYAVEPSLSRTLRLDCVLRLHALQRPWHEVGSAGTMGSALICSRGRRPLPRYLFSHMPVFLNAN